VQLIALVERIEHVCCRYRLSAYRPFWEEAGHRLELRELPTTAWSWIRLGRDLRSADAIILQRKLPRPWQLCLLRRASRALYFDFDDAVFLRDSYASKGLHSGRRRRRFAAMARAADSIVAGNSFLAQEATRWAGKERVHVIPTCLNPDSYPLAAHTGADESVRLVWIGSSSTLRGLERARALLQEVSRALPRLSLKVVCDRFPDLGEMAVQRCPWSPQRESAELATADIGISWVPDDLWSRGKCGLKVLQYMAAGLPVVANPVGVHAEIVRHGKTGFLTASPAQWIEAVRWLARDPGLRQRMGQSGRRLVEAIYHTRVGAARWLTLLGGREARRKSA